MTWPVYRVEDLADFSGAPAKSYKPFASEALRQATFLFKIATQLPDAPTLADSVQLMKYAILEMADGIYLAQAFRKQRNAPFQSESIGSYSYSIATVRDKAIAALPTGVSYFDMAVAQLGVGAQNEISTDSISSFEYDYPVTTGGNGHRYLAHGWEVAYQSFLRQHAYLHDPAGFVGFTPST